MNQQKIRKNTIEKGREGEERAARFMEGKGYELLRRNFRSGRAEIDLIFRKGQLLVFAEVKMRKNNLFGEPEIAVNTKKEELIVEAAEDFIYEQDWKGEVRFDILSVEGGGRVTHFEDAFH
jgi:putative endonuclease